MKELEVQDKGRVIAYQLLPWAKQIQLGKLLLSVKSRVGLEREIKNKTKPTFRLSPPCSFQVQLHSLFLYLLPSSNTGGGGIGLVASS